MRLLWVELRRLFARRFLWIGVLVLLAGLVTVLGATAYDSRVPTEQELAQAREQVAAEAPRAQAAREQCEEAERNRRQNPPPATGTGDPSSPPHRDEVEAGVDCSAIVPPTEEVFLTSQVFRYTDEMLGRTHALTVILALFAFLVGATAVGAEWHHGTLAGLLLWEPRRIRVYLAKLMALVGSLTLVSVLSYAASTAGHWGVAQWRGVVGSLTPSFQRDIALAGARGLAVTLVGAAAGFAIAFTLRRTAAAMGVAMAYFALVEIGVSAYFPQSPRWLLTTYLQAWLSKGTQLSLYACGPQGCEEKTVTISMWQGGIYLGALALLLLAVAAVVFRRREVA